MDPTYEATRLVDVARALKLSRALAEQERWPRERLAALQRERVAALERHAREHSAFYRDGAPAPLDKATMMERFDDIVCDPRLKRDALLAHVEGLPGDALYLRRYRVMTTSGSSGLKGLFVYDRDAWAAVLAQFLRFTDWAGTRPRLPRLRVAAVVGGSPSHMSRRCAAAMAIGLHKLLALPVTAPLPRMVEALNAFQPGALHAYPSIAVLLAGEQRAGRLRIAPEVVTTSSELRTAEMCDAIAEAFGVRPIDLYATTEGLWGADCGHGHHLFEDVTLVENVDEEGRPVPDGERGARLLVTNLCNRVQPLIRFEVSDVVTLDPEPCPCGRTLRRMRAIDGRADAVLRLPGASGPVAVHPLQFGVVTADRQVREFQVVQRGDGVRLRVVLRDPDDAAASARLRERVAGRLAALGVREPRVEVERCAALERPPEGKLQLVVAERAS